MLQHIILIYATIPLYMGNWAERIIVRQVQEESRIKQEKIALQNKIFQEKKQEANVLTLRLFPYRYINYERFWNFIAYTYFIGKTLGLIILIGLLFFGRLNTILFTLIFLCFCYFNLKLYKRRKLSMLH